MKKKGLKLVNWLTCLLRVENRNYPKVTFRLSIIGFIGSIGFYIGVLRDIGGNEKDKSQEIENLKMENETLKNQVDLLIEKC